MKCCQTINDLCGGIGKLCSNSAVTPYPPMCCGISNLSYSYCSQVWGPREYRNESWAVGQIFPIICSNGPSTDRTYRKLEHWYAPGTFNYHLIHPLRMYVPLEWVLMQWKYTHNVWLFFVTLSIEKISPFSKEIVKSGWGYSTLSNVACCICSEQCFLKGTWDSPQFTEAWKIYGNSRMWGKTIWVEKHTSQLTRLSKSYDEGRNVTGFQDFFNGAAWCHIPATPADGWMVCSVLLAFVKGCWIDLCYKSTIWDS